ncbi:MAG: hypothetical protein WC222_04595 [Parachlamydiales bacterium]
MNSLITYKLDFDKVYNHFLEHLPHGNFLSSEILQQINLKTGIFYTFLPQDLTDNQLYGFSYGGVLSELEEKKIPQYLNFFPTPNTDLQTALFIGEFLSLNNNNAVIFEDVSARATDSNIGIEGTQTCIFNDDVYYIVQASFSIDLIKKCIFNCGEAWHFLCVLSKNVPKMDSTLVEEDFKRIYSNVQYIIIGAYDGEGYIIWENKADRA